MKYILLFLPLVFLSCVFENLAIRKATYPLPNGKKMLFVNITSPFFYDSYEEINNANQLIYEKLEELGYSLVISEKIWEDSSVNTVTKDNLEIFQKKIKTQWQEDRPRIQIWKERAELIDASGIFLLRYNFSSENKSKEIRMFWIRLDKNEVNRFDWTWNPDAPIPFYESIRYSLEGEK